jgi:hypothetical protein
MDTNHTGTGGDVVKNAIAAIFGRGGRRLVLNPFFVRFEMEPGAERPPVPVVSYVTSGLPKGLLIRPRLARTFRAKKGKEILLATNLWILNLWHSMDEKAPHPWKRSP